jgi:sulfoxide reductase heme-binding subunit YedZ
LILPAPRLPYECPRRLGDWGMMFGAVVSGPTAYWYLTRGTGVVSLLALTASVALGILNSERYAAPRWPRFAVDRIHRDLSLLALAVIAVHVVTTVLDGFAPITLLDGVIPFLSPYRPIWLGLGTLAFDVLLAVAITSLLRRRIGFRAWRAVHWTAYASWPIAAFHGVGTGTDAGSSWLLAVTVLCTGVVIGATAVRILRATTDRGSGRGLWLAVTAATPIALAAFAVVGPLAPHWARRAGTPASVLRKAHPVSAVTAASPPAASATPAGAKDAIPVKFNAHLSGTVAQTEAPGGALVDLVLHCRGQIRGEMRVRMAGAPLPSGGLSMTGSQVQLTAVGLRSVLTGQIVSLQGTEFEARVRDRTGTSLALHASLNIDNSNNTVTGTLNAHPS